MAIPAEPQSCLTYAPESAFQMTKLSASLPLKALRRVPCTVLPGKVHTFARQSPVQHPQLTSRALATLNRDWASLVHLVHTFPSLCTRQEWLPPSAYGGISTSAPCPVRPPWGCPLSWTHFHDNTCTGWPSWVPAAPSLGWGLLESSDRRLFRAVTDPGPLGDKRGASENAWKLQD